MPDIHLQSIHNIAAICAAQGIGQAIISPGSRSAPLTTAFAQHPAITCRVVMDERAAAFIALGIAQQTRRAVVLICTSGTAGLNYGPAVAEAYYQRVPLVIFTADRPPEWIDQQDNQTTHQNDFYGRHVRAKYTLPVASSHSDDIWYLQRLVSEAVNQAHYPVCGPVHVNVPLREPLYPEPQKSLQFSDSPARVTMPETQATLNQTTWHQLRQTWQTAQRKLILVGTHPPDARLVAVLNTFQPDPNVVIVSDITANVIDVAQDSPKNMPPTAPHADMILSTKVTETRKALIPDLLLSFGGSFVSKSLKLFLRQHQPKIHWRLDPSGHHIDTYQCLTHHIPVDPVYFLAKLANFQTAAPFQETPPAPQSYRQIWLNCEAEAQKMLNQFLQGQKFGEFQAVAQILSALPSDSHLQLGNSMAVRYVSYLGLPQTVTRTDSNRGTSGIDGSLSTAVGAALTVEKITTLIIGDLGFFYDRNALWHHHIPPNLRIVILNNHGGGIFQMIDGPNKLASPIVHTYFDTPHPLTAERTAADHGCAYFHCTNASDLQETLPQFFSSSLAQAAILEIETDMTINTTVFQKFREVLAGLG